MTRTLLKGRWGAPAILLVGAVAFGLGLWARVSLHPGPTGLERLIAQNAPAENVQALTARLTGAAEYLVGTSLGVIHGAGKKWARLPGPETAVRSIAALPDGTLLVAGHGTGVAKYQESGLMPVLPGDADAIAATPSGRLYAILSGRQVVTSSDGGKTWVQAASFGGEQMLALAAGEAGVAVGGLQGSIFFSPDGGRTWESRPAPGGSVTALLFDPSKSGRLWACAGGAALYSDDDGTTWRQPALKKAANRPLVALSPAPAGQTGIAAVSADGLLVTMGD
ncbi:MAG TPA: hypothetical protein VD969_07205 [Symbiobacteriaceae bacterium]|nr:hypothetical protein [Symbiobacteriaceae bacterium]